jgi:NhaA family Na+:H+ antiporter
MASPAASCNALTVAALFHFVTASYIILGLGLWGATLASGVHATIAGVLLAFTIPATRQIEEADYVAYADKMLAIFKREAARDAERITDDQSHALKALEEASQAVQTPLARVEHGLLVPVTYLIVPLFALANAGVDLRSSGMSALSSPVAWGVLLGLLIGKPVGVLLLSWIAWRAGIASMPEGATWRQMTGAAILCGIGFTMSMFVANLAFADAPEQLAIAKLGILIASVIAGGFGGAVILLGQRLLRPVSIYSRS